MFRKKEAAKMNAEIDIERLQGRLDRTPYNAWLGLRLTHADGERVVIEMVSRPEQVSTPERQIIHGGVLAALIDAAAIYAVIAATGVLNTTIDLRVDYHAPARVGTLRCVGTVLRLGRTVSSAEARVLDPAGGLIASGRSAFMTLGLPI